MITTTFYSTTKKFVSICMKFNGGWQADNFECVPREMINDSTLNTLLCLLAKGENHYA